MLQKNLSKPFGAIRAHFRNFYHYSFIFSICCWFWVVFLYFLMQISGIDILTLVRNWGNTSVSVQGWDRDWKWFFYKEYALFFLIMQNKVKEFWICSVYLIRVLQSYHPPLCQSDTCTHWGCLQVRVCIRIGLQFCLRFAANRETQVNFWFVFGEMCIQAMVLGVRWRIGSLFGQIANRA
jgi:hypothetical protein